MPLKGIGDRREGISLSSAHWRGSVSSLGKGLKEDHNGTESILTNRISRLCPRVNNMASLSLFADVTGSLFDNIAHKGRNEILSMLFRTFCHVV
ncbi:MAG: hypothetical protein SWQ30_04520 [Thermodesulfobacteriota bacterium]|nr:hypothetical protein [Thermodesulfobacteriota bacterium]